MSQLVAVAAPVIALTRQPNPPRPAMVRCSGCGAMNDPSRGSTRCVNCGLPL